MSETPVTTVSAASEPTEVKPSTKKSCSLWQWFTRQRQGMSQTPNPLLPWNNSKTAVRLSAAAATIYLSPLSQRSVEMSHYLDKVALENKSYWSLVLDLFYYTLFQPVTLFDAITRKSWRFQTHEEAYRIEKWLGAALLLFNLVLVITALSSDASGATLLGQLLSGNLSAITLILLISGLVYVFNGVFPLYAFGILIYLCFLPYVFLAPISLLESTFAGVPLLGPLTELLNVACWAWVVFLCTLAITRVCQLNALRLITFVGMMAFGVCASVAIGSIALMNLTRIFGTFTIR
jgi:hypothetical protein